MFTTNPKQIVKSIVRKDTGEIVNAHPKLEDMSSITVFSEVEGFNGNLWGVKKRQALITLPNAKMRQFFPEGIKEGDVFPGRINRIESFNSFWDNQQPVRPSSDKDPVMKNGRVYYRNDIYDQHSKMSDILIEDIINGSKKDPNVKEGSLEEFDNEVNMQAQPDMSGGMV